MRNLKEQLVNVGEKFGCRFINDVGNMAVKIGDQSRGLCFFFSDYEPKIPMELLKENIE